MLLSSSCLLPMLLTGARIPIVYSQPGGGPGGGNPGGGGGGGRPPPDDDDDEPDEDGQGPEIPNATDDGLDGFYDQEALHLGLMGPLNQVMESDADFALQVLIAFALTDFEFSTNFANPKKDFSTGCRNNSLCNSLPLFPIPNVSFALRNLSLQLQDEGTPTQRTFTPAAAARAAFAFFDGDYRVNAVVGGYDSAGATETAVVFNVFTTVQNNYGGQSDDLTVTGPFPYFFRVVPPLSNSVSAAWEYFIHFGWRGFHVVHCVIPDTQHTVDNLLELAHPQGRGEQIIVSSFSAPDEESTLDPAIVGNAVNNFLIHTDFRLVVWDVPATFREGVFDVLIDMNVTSPRFQFLSVEHSKPYNANDDLTSMDEVLRHFNGWHEMRLKDQSATTSALQVQALYRQLTAEDVRKWLRELGRAEWASSTALNELEDSYFSSTTPHPVLYRILQAFHGIVLAMNDMLVMGYPRQQIRSEQLNRRLRRVAFQMFDQSFVFNSYQEVLLDYDLGYLDFRPESSAAQEGRFWTGFCTLRLGRDITEGESDGPDGDDDDDEKVIFGPGQNRSNVLWATGEFSSAVPKVLVDCHPGSFETDQLRCESCAPGSVSTDYGQTACEVCPIGTQSGDGTECVECQPGRYAEAGSAACLECKSGRFTELHGESECTPCRHGQAQALAGQTACSLCDLGSVANVTGMSACIQCDRGRASHAAGRAASCSNCAAGQFANGSGFSACELCMAGKYSLVGEDTCHICPLGTFGDGSGGSVCDNCPSGYYSDSEGSTGCEACDPFDMATSQWTTLEVYQDDIIQVYGAKDKSYCSCQPGWRQHGDECKECEEGLRCYGLTRIVVEAGYFSEEDVISVFKCEDDLRCPGGSPGSTCAAGRTSTACAECLQGYVPIATGECTRCSFQTGYMGFACTLFIVALLLGFVYSMQGRSRILAPSKPFLFMIFTCSLVLVWLQQLVVIGLLDIGWSGPALDLFNALAVLSFDLDVIGLVCIVGPGAVSSYVSKLCTVFGFVAFVAIVHLAHMILVKVRRADPRDPAATALTSGGSSHHQFVATVGTIFMSLYITIAEMVVEPAQCKLNPNSRWTVRNYRGIVCWEAEDEHVGMLCASTLAFLLVPVAFLARVSNLLFQLPQRIRMMDTAFLRTYSFLFERFHPKSYWFGSLYVFRNLLIALVPALPTVALEIIALQSVLVMSVCANIWWMPWRFFYLNVLDSFLTVITCFMLLLAAFYSTPSGADRRSIGYAFWAFFIVIAFSTFAVVVASMLRHCRPKKKRFEYFLCHHKAGAGAFVRLLKLLLQNSSGKRGSATASAATHLSRPTGVFVDSDDLDNLGRLFDYVSFETQNLVMVASKELFSRPWCLGEMTITRMRGISAVLLALADMELPSSNFIENLEEQVVGMDVLSENDIDVDMVQDTLRWVSTVRRIDGPDDKITILAMDQVISRLHAVCRGGAFATAAAREAAQTAAVPVPKQTAGSVGNSSAASVPTDAGADLNSQQQQEALAAIIVDSESMEAAATAHVLKLMILPQMAFSTKVKMIPVILEPHILPTGVQAAVALCTNGVLTPGCSFLESAGLVHQAGIRILPVVAEFSFKFPSETDLQRLEEQISPSNPTTYAAVVQTIFKEIALLFHASMASESTLRSQSSDIARRWINICMEMRHESDGDLVSEILPKRLSARLADRSFTSSTPIPKSVSASSGVGGMSRSAGRLKVKSGISSTGVVQGSDSNNTGIQTTTPEVNSEAVAVMLSKSEGQHGAASPLSQAISIASPMVLPSPTSKLLTDQPSGAGHPATKAALPSTPPRAARSKGKPDDEHDGLEDDWVEVKL